MSLEARIQRFISLRAKVENVTPYEFAPLETKNHVRLFRLNLGQNDEVLKCEIVHVALPQQPAQQGVRYTALSYVCGNSFDFRYLSCGDGQLKVPSNLHDALLQLRREERCDTLLWADCVCIHQSDPVEKSDQVARMHRIYSGAQEVIMWQGTSDREVDGALESLDKLVDIIVSGKESGDLKDFERTYQICQGHKGQGQGQGRGQEEDIRTVVDQAVPGLHWSALSALLSRPYFSRTWIFQESVLAKQAVLVCGSQKTSWTAIADRFKNLPDQGWTARYQQAAMILMDMNPSSPSVADNLMRMVTSAELRFGGRRHATDSLREVLQGTSGLSCSETRDRLYAILHAVTGLDLEREPELKPDYQATVGEVFHRLAIWFISKHSQCIYLLWAENLGRSAERGKLLGEDLIPSWVPFDAVCLRSSEETLGQSVDTASYWSFDASKSTSTATSQFFTLKQEPVLACNDKHLSLVGNFVDAIDKTTATKPVSYAASKAAADSLGDDFERLRRSGLKATNLLLAQSVKRDLAELSDDPQALLRSSDFRRIAEVAIALAFPRDSSSTGSAALITEFLEYLDRFHRTEAPVPYLSGEPIGPKLETLLTAWWSLYGARKLFVTKNGRLGLVCWRAQAGDVVAVLHGVQLPLVLRAVLEARLEQAQVLKKVVEAIKDLVQDCNFDCNDSGIALQAMDNSHVALVSMMLKAESFSPFRCDRNIALGINLTALTKVLRCAQNEDILTLKAEDAPDVVNLVFESMETDRLSEYDIKLMDIDQEHLGIPDTEYAATITMPSAEFQRICRDLLALSESVSIEATKEGVKFSCQGDIGNGSVTLRNHTNVDKPQQNVEIDLTESVALTFSLKYLVNFCKASGLSDTVKLCLSSEVPLLVEYGLASNSHLRFYLAPKIGEEEA